MSAPNAIVIGTTGRHCRSPHAERRAPVDAARLRVRTPIPRRIPHEFYPTPPEAVRALLSVEAFDGPVWEPACGEGAIATALGAAGHSVVSTDLFDYGFGLAGIDFLAEAAPRARHIVTNPPYGHGLADAFMMKALALTRQTGGKVALFLNLASLCHPRRTALWRQMPPARIYAVDDIVCWPAHLYGPAPEAFTRHRYYWAVWHPDHRGAPQFWWLSGSAFR
jgi:hypothetical protein